MSNVASAFRFNRNKKNNMRPTSPIVSTSSSSEYSDGETTTRNTRKVVDMTNTSPYLQTDLCLFPPTLRTTAWCPADATQFRIRSADYLQSQHKVPSLPAVMDLICVDLVQAPVAMKQTGLCAVEGERMQLALQRGTPELPAFVFAVNLCIPNKHNPNTNYHWVAYFGTNDVDALKDVSTPLGRVAQPFFFGTDDAFRSRTFKLIPRIVQGNVLVRKAVGSKPSILGKKLKQYYICNDRFMEVVVDIGSEKVAQRIVKLALGYAKTLTVDMMFVLQGHDEETLPERIMGGVRMSELDFKQKDGQRVVVG